MSKIIKLNRGHKCIQNISSVLFSCSLEYAVQIYFFYHRFGTLWKFRYQVWPRMEDGANLFFKVLHIFRLH